MNKIINRLYTALFISVLVITCNASDIEKATAKTHCSSCRQFPDPSLLDKNTWEKKVLPAYGKINGCSGGSFNTKEILSFPPVFGSTYFEMIDVDKDGLKDILYTCGDNGDYSNVLKSYHGIYVFINKGNNRFEQKFFFPLHGAFKAIARDFDKDGDLDIAAISFFPDSKNQPQESFVYLENNTNFKFMPNTIKEFNEGRWITMDAGDIDQDGDEDIIIGSLYLQQEQLLSPTDFTEKPLFLLLDNLTIID